MAPYPQDQPRALRNRRGGDGRGRRRVAVVGTADRHGSRGGWGGGHAAHQLHGVQVGDAGGLARPVVVPDAEPRLRVARVGLLGAPGVGKEHVDVAVRARQLLGELAEVRCTLGLRDGRGGPAVLGDLDRHLRSNELVDGLAEAGDAHLGVGHVRLVGVEADAVHAAGQVGAVGEHALHEGDLVGAAAEAAEREPADHDVCLRVDAADRVAGAHVEVRVALGGVVLRAPEDGGVLLVPDLVLGHGNGGEGGVRLPEAAARPVATGERRGVGGEVRDVARRDRRQRVARAHPGPGCGVGDDRQPAQPVLGQALHDAVVHRPVVVVVASARRGRLHVLPASVDARHL